MFHEIALSENGLVIVDANQGRRIDISDPYSVSDTAEVTIFGFGGDDTLIGSFKHDILVGGTGNDSLNGGFGNDRFVGGAGADTIDGGDGHDTIVAGAGNDNVEGGAGTDSLIGGSGNDTITDSEDGATMFGGSGNDSMSVAGDEGIMYGGSGDDTLDASQATGNIVLSGGSGNDVLHGNGQSVLQGGSGADVFRIQTGDVIIDPEAKDTLYLNGQLISAFDGQEPDLLLGLEVGPVGNPVMTTSYSVDGLATSASLAIALRVNRPALPEDFNGTYQGVSYTAYIYVNATQAEDYPQKFYSVGVHTGYIFDLWAADFVISDFRLGDFGIFPQGAYFELVHNTLDLAGQFIHDGVDYHLGTGGDFIHGPGRSLSEDELADETAFEALIEGTEDDPLFPGNDGAPSPAGTSGDDIYGSAILTASVAGAATGDEMFDGGEGNDIIQGNDGSDTLIGGDGDDTIIGGNFAFEQLIPEPPVVGEPVGFAAVDTDGDGLISLQEVTVLEPWLPDIEQLFEEFETTEDGHWNEQEFSVAVAPFDLPYPYNPDDGGGEIPPPEVPADLGDDLSGGEGDDLIYGGDGEDIITGDAGQDLIFGEADNDTLSGGDGYDQRGGRGNSGQSLRWIA